MQSAQASLGQARATCGGAFVERRASVKQVTYVPQQLM